MSAAPDNTVAGVLFGRLRCPRPAFLAGALLVLPALLHAQERGEHGTTIGFNVGKLAQTDTRMSSLTVWVRQTVASSVFLELETTSGHARASSGCPGQSTCSPDKSVLLASFGVGVHRTFGGVFRPSLLAGIGTQRQGSAALFWAGGMSFSPESPRVSLYAEYRLRRSLRSHALTTQYGLGMAIRIR